MNSNTGDMLTPASLTGLFRQSGTLDPGTIDGFRGMILARFHDSPRPMPWRETTDPYRILVSEIMLQQTQVDRVRQKYAEFLRAFPTVAVLASAALSEVLTLWQGLGYNRRALYLKRCAERIVSDHGGEFPRTVSELETLPGIGAYTARAVAAFAFGVAEPLIETNIRAVYIHFFFNGSENVADREIMPLIAATLDKSAPREWYYALMDYGSGLKRKNANPGRRSSHYVRQSRFEGSNRQLRSSLLVKVVANPGIAEAELVSLGEDAAAIRRNLEALQEEGFLERTGDRFYVSGGNRTGER